MEKKQPGEKIITEKEIKQKNKELAREIENDYQGKEPVFISILKSSVYFLSDLTRNLNLPLNIDFLGIGRYPTADNRGGEIHIEKNLELNISGRHVIIIDTIINTGLTHSYLIKNLQPRKPESLNICTLIENPTKRLVGLPIAYQGFTFSDPDLFVVGYGLDYCEDYRHLPYICHYDRDDRE